MIRTVVCQNDGCSGNNFLVETVDNKIKAICRECGGQSLYNSNEIGCILISNCKSCNSDGFKLFLDTEKNSVFAKCVECGEPPEKIFIDEYGNQISSEEKILNEVKEALYTVNQRMCNLEIKIENMEKGQEVIEEALAYINRYIVK